MNIALAAEDMALLACVRPTRSAEYRNRFSHLSEGPIEWPRVLGNARAQRVAALCFPAIQEIDGAVIPAEVIDAFRAAATATAARNLQLAARLGEIEARARQAGIPLVSYKGAVLAEMAYGNLGLREFADLDFILPHGRLHEAWDLLQSLGCQPLIPALAAADAPIPGEYVFLSADKSVHLELHTELTLRHFPTPPDLESLLGAMAPVTLLGKPVLTFCPEDTLPLLAVHGAKDFWAQLLWICDVAWLVQKPGFDWDRALERSERMGCRRMTNIALLLASESLEAPMPREVLERAQADAKARTTAQRVIERLFAAEAMNRWEQLRYRMGTVEGFWPGIRYAARLATTPAADDWNAMRLPTPLGFAYALLRPLRLFRR